MAKTPKLLLIDGNNYLCRAFFATQGKMSSKKAGIHTNAIRGFVNILLADLSIIKPSHVCITFDKHGKNWRSEIYPEYKMNRKRTKDENDPRWIKKQADNKSMREQEPWLKKLLRAMGFRVVARSGEEADDFMGTLAKEYERKGFEVVIGSGDKDMCQVVSKSITVMSGTERTMLTPARVRAKFGVKPSQIVDFLSLLGDKVDNVPGVHGVGAGWASKLLNAHGDAATIYRKRSSLPPGMLKAFTGAKDTIKLNRRLISLNLETPHAVEEEELVFPNETYNDKKVASLCLDLDMKATASTLKKARKRWEVKARAGIR